MQMRTGIPKLRCYFGNMRIVLNEIGDGVDYECLVMTPVADVKIKCVENK